MNVDVVNGLFEAGGAVVACMNVFKLLEEKTTRGVYWPATAFFSAWGTWNLYYYPALDQWRSFYGGLLLVMCNYTWVLLVLYFKWTDWKARRHAQH
jgi:hypothetical protein